MGFTVAPLDLCFLPPLGHPAQLLRMVSNTPLGRSPAQGSPAPSCAFEVAFGEAFWDTFWRALEGSIGEAFGGPFEGPFGNPFGVPFGFGWQRGRSKK